MVVGEPVISNFLLLEDEHGYVNVVVQGWAENDGAPISVAGWRFKELEVGALTHGAHEFR